MKILFLLCLTAVFFSACQREPDFTPVDNRTSSTDSLPTNTAAKAIVFDGSLFPSNPAMNYDSLIFSVNASSGTISNYAKNGIVMWQDLITYDAQGRVTKYIGDYDPGVNYRHCYFSYSGVDTFPSALIDSFYDGQLFITKLTRTGSTTSGSGTVLTYLYKTLMPSLNYSDSFNAKYSFATNGRLIGGASEGGQRDIQEKYLYNTNSSLDSIHTSSTTLSGTKTTDLKLLYTTNISPLAPLAKTVYKNLYSFLPFDISLYGNLLNISGLPSGFFAPMLLSSAKEFEDQVNDIGYTFGYQFQGTVLKSGSVQSFDAYSVPSTTTTAVRYY